MTDCQRNVLPMELHHISYSENRGKARKQGGLSGAWVMSTELNLKVTAKLGRQVYSFRKQNGFIYCLKFTQGKITAKYAVNKKHKKKLKKRCGFCVFFI